MSSSSKKPPSRTFKSSNRYTCFVTTDKFYNRRQFGPKCNRRDPTAPHVLEAGKGGLRLRLDAAACAEKERDNGARCARDRVTACGDSAPTPVSVACLSVHGMGDLQSQVKSSF